MQSKTKQYKGILFDLDGTLLDTANDLGEALNYVLTQHNMPLISRSAYRPVASDGSTGLLNLGFKDKLKQFDVESLRQEFLNYYENNIAEHTCLYKGVRELINYLDNKNIPWGVVTNKPIGLTLKLLPYFPEFKKCKSVIGGDSLAQRKPHPEPLFFASDEIGVVAKDVIYVGDAPRDIEAGNAAGMLTIVAQWGYIPESQDSSSWGASIIEDSPESIIQLFDK